MGRCPGASVIAFLSALALVGCIMIYSSDCCHYVREESIVEKIVDLFSPCLLDEKIYSLLGYVNSLLGYVSVFSLNIGRYKLICKNKKYCYPGTFIINVFGSILEIWEN